VLIGFSNGIRGAKWFTAPKALGDSDNDMSCHARKYGTGGASYQLHILERNREKNIPMAPCSLLPGARTAEEEQNGRLIRSIH
jgi:hypothetical protein